MQNLLDVIVKVSVGHTVIHKRADVYMQSVQDCYWTLVIVMKISHFIRLVTGMENGAV